MLDEVDELLLAGVELFRVNPERVELLVVLFVVAPPVELRLLIPPAFLFPKVLCERE